MLTFFRHIRKSLLGSGQAKKYLLYAIGEILLVMIGILLALQVNNWNEWRKDRVKEKTVLYDLADNLALITSILEERIAWANECTQSAGVILSVIDQKLPYSDTLRTHFHHARITPYFSFLPQSGFENLKNTGFDILTSDPLKRELLNLFENTYPYTNEIIDNFKNSNAYWENYISTNFHFEDSKYGPGTLVPVDIQLILNDHYYKTQISQIQGRVEHIVMLQENCIQETQRVLKLIKEELGQE